MGSSHIHMQIDISIDANACDPCLQNVATLFYLRLFISMQVSAIVSTYLHICSNLHKHLICNSCCADKSLSAIALRVWKVLR